MQSEKLLVVGLCAGALFSEGIKPKKGPPHPGGLQSGNVWLARVGRSPQACVPLEGCCSGVPGSWEPGGRGHEGDTGVQEGTPWGLGVLVNTLGF